MIHLSYGDIRRFDDKLDAILKGHEAIALVQQQQAQTLATLTSHIGAIMTTLAELAQNMADLRTLAQQYLDLIIAKDQANAALQQQITDLINAAAISQAEKDALLAGIAQAVSDSQATEDLMRAGLPGVPPVGGTPLNTSYPDLASFQAAVAAYTGPEAVTLDGVEVKTGTAPNLDYFTHSDAGGVINTTGPTS